MKHIFLTLGILILLSCTFERSNKVVPNFQEVDLSFLHLRFGYDKENTWIKKPRNILMLHETFKMIGYENLISEEEWNHETNMYIDVRRSPANMLDSLILTYDLQKPTSKYYREFWQRRKSEGNEDMVFHVIRQIKDIREIKIDEEVDVEMMNDTLLTLLSYEYPKRKLNDKESNTLLKYLIRIGLHKSAYNLISGENTRFQEVKWDKDQEDITKGLNESELYQRPWFEDNSK